MKAGDFVLHEREICQIEILHDDGVIEIDLPDDFGNPTTCVTIDDVIVLEDNHYLDTLKRACEPPDVKCDTDATPPEVPDSLRILRETREDMGVAAQALIDMYARWEKAESEDPDDDFTMASSAEMMIQERAKLKQKLSMAQQVYHNAIMAELGRRLSEGGRL